MFSRPKTLFFVSLLFVALLNPKFNPYLPFKFLIFYHSIVLVPRLCSHKDVKWLANMIIAIYMAYSVAFVIILVVLMWKVTTTNIIKNM